MKKKISHNQGFTLIEIIVSLAVFIVVATISVGAFLKILTANKQSQALETAMNNANFALDSMTRDLRVGEDFYCYDSQNDINVTSLSGKQTCNNNSFLVNESQSQNANVMPAIAFYSSQTPSSGWSCPGSPIHIYRYNPNSGLIEKAEQICGSDGIPLEVGEEDTFVPLTDINFNIQTFGIDVDFESLPNSVLSQPKVFITMTATVGSNAQNQTTFSVQTTASERIMNGQ